MAANRKELLQRAQICEQADRWDDMVVNIKKVAELNEELTIGERNMLSVAYKNVVGARRSAWRLLSCLEQSPDSSVGGLSDQRKQQITKEYREKIEQELQEACMEIIQLLTKNLIGTSQNKESKTFYLKMKGDYYRYLAELGLAQSGEASYQTEAKKAYGEAMELSADLNAAHPVRLGLVLNFSVFNFEILNQYEEACTIGQQAFDKAIAELDDMQEDTFKDSSLILQLLKDNLTLWASESGDRKG